MLLKTILRFVKVFVVFSAFLIPFLIIQYLDGGLKALSDPEFTKNAKLYLVVVFFMSIAGVFGRAAFGRKEKNEK